MAFNIEQFRADGLERGGARPTKFKVDLFLPNGMGSTQLNRFSLMIQAASLPGFYVDPVQVPYFGRIVNFAGDRIFQPWQVLVQNDEDFPVRAVLEKWQNSINALISNRMSQEMAQGNNYKASAEVTQLGQAGDTLRAYRFVGLWPSQIDQIQLDWGQMNQYEMFGVTFSYDYYEPIDQSSSVDTYNPVFSDDGQYSGNILPGAGS
jgi:hypothetical protein